MPNDRALRPLNPTTFLTELANDMESIINEAKMLVAMDEDLQRVMMEMAQVDKGSLPTPTRNKEQPLRPLALHSEDTVRLDSFCVAGFQE